MLTFAEIIGNAQAIELLERLARTSRVPQALLFRGPEGVGKATVARAFAAALLCENGPTDACGRCSSCKQVAQDHHPDLLWIRRLAKTSTGSASSAPEGEPDETELKSEIVVAQIRELSQLAGLAPREGRRRIFIVDPADRMNRSAQNALLKTLEEPPDRAVLILVASRPHLLLPTVRSRSFEVGFSALRAPELSRALQAAGMERREADERAALACGCAGRAIELDLPALRERRQEILGMLEVLSAHPAPLERLPALAASLAGKEEATLLAGLDLLQSLLRDAARIGAATDQGALVHADLSQRLSRLGRDLDSTRAVALLEASLRLRGYLRFHTNRVLIAESLLAAVAGGPLPG